MPAHEPTDLDVALEALYAGPLDEFVAGRDAAVRRVADSGDRLGAERVSRLPRPSVAAWVVNHVVREHPEEVAALAALGAELRTATRDRDRGRLRALDQLRRERTEALVRGVREAGEIGGRLISSAVLDRLAETLTAAVMDPDAAVAVRAGRLSRALQHVGFGTVDEQGEEADLVVLRSEPRSADGADGAGTEPVVDRAADARKATRPRDEPATSASAESTANRTRRDLTEAERVVEETSAQVDELEAHRDDVRDRLRTAETVVERTQGEVERLDRELDRVRAERDMARGSLDEARSVADGVRADLTGVEHDLADAIDRSAEARRRRRAARG